MNPENQNPSTNPQAPIGSGSDWQRQAMAAVHRPATQQNQQTAQQLADQQVPDMLAAVDPVPQQAAPSASTQQSTPVPQAGFSTGEESSSQPAVISSFGEDVSPAPVSGGGGSSVGKKLIGILVILIVVIGLAVGAYFVFFADKNSASEDPKKNINKSAVDISTLDDVTFVAPNNMDGYSRDTVESSDTFAAYKTTDNTCSVAFGTQKLAATDPKTGDALTEALIAAVKDSGATVDGPHVKDALVLKDADDPSVTYKIPTISYTFKRDGTTGKVLYSLTVLRNGDLVAVGSSCVSHTGDVADETLELQTKKTQEVTVKVKAATP